MCIRDSALYDAETDGNLLWQENHSSVMVTKGLFDLILGSENPLPDTLSFSAQYWLQVSVDGEILSPRIPLASVPYSFRSLVADSVVNITLDTLQAYYDTLQLQTSGNADVHWDNLTGVPVGFSDGIDNVDDADNVVGNEVVTGLSFDTGTGELSLTQNAGISPITQNLDGRYALSSGNVTGSGLDNYISRWNGTSTLENSVIYQTDVGNVGIGTTTPSYKLDVSGTGRYTGALTIGAYTLPASDGTGGYVLNWMTNGQLALFVVSAAATWKMLGYNIVFFLAGLQNVPGELLEAARVDGAGGWRTFWKITFPMLSPTTTFLLFVNMLYSVFQVFGLIDIMTRGGPGNATNILVYNLYRDAFIHLDSGSASAQSFIIFIVISIAAVVQLRVATRKAVYAR